MTSAFNYRLEYLDSIEMAVRDDLGVNLHQWVLFRRAINCGSSAVPPVLTFSAGFESDERKDAFLDLGKSNYEVVCCLGYAKQALEDIKALTLVSSSDLLRFMRLSKEFYFHAGSVLDNFARLIYIINDAASPGSTLLRRGQTILRRRWVAWGDFETEIRSTHSDYVPFVDDQDMQRFRNVRHFLTHVWAPVKKMERNVISWPEQIRTSRVYAWPHDPLDKNEFDALTFVPVLPMMEQDWNALERFQNNVYEQLTKDVTAKFQPNYGCTILPIT